jgi:rhamnosyltransferase
MDCIKSKCNKAFDEYKEIYTSVLVAIITYNGQASISRTIQLLKKASAVPLETIIIDNASTDETCHIVSQFKEIPILRLNKNYGLGFAYNKAIEYATRCEKQWLILLDQDSECQAKCVDILIQYVHVLKQNGYFVGAICPSVYSRKYPGCLHKPYNWNGRYFLPAPYDSNETNFIRQIDSPISSGTLYSVDALQNIGGFREDYFIDFVDHECHLRMKKFNWSLWWAQDAHLSHELGSIQKMTDNGLWIEHEPWRYYYMARNMYATYVQHGGYAALWPYFSIVFNHISSLRKYSQTSNSCLWNIMKGISHGILGKFKIPSA